MDTEKRQFVIIGTSHVHHARFEFNEQLLYSKWFSDNYKYPPTYMAKRGGKFNSEFMEEIREFIKTNDRKLTIFLNMGSNDLRFPRDSLDSAKKSPADIMCYVEAIHTFVRHHKDATLILSSPIIDVPNFEVYKDDFSELSTRLKRFAIMNRLLFFDTQKHMMLFGRPNLELFRDPPEWKFENRKKDRKVRKNAKLPVTYQKDIHLNLIGNSYFVGKVTGFLENNYQMHKDAKALEIVKELDKTMGGDFVYEIFVYRKQNLLFKWPDGCQWCMLAIFYCETDMSAQTPPDIELDNIVFYSKEVWNFERKLRKLELYDIAENADYTKTLRKFGISMPHLAEKIQSYVIGENVRKFLDRYEFIQIFKRSIGKWAIDDIGYRTIFEHVKHGLTDHLKWLRHFKCLRMINEGYKWACFQSLLDNFPKMISMVRDIHYELLED